MNDKLTAADPWQFGLTELISIGSMCATMAGAIAIIMAARVARETIKQFKDRTYAAKELEAVIEFSKVIVKSRHVFKSIRHPFTHPEEGLKVIERTTRENPDINRPHKFHAHYAVVERMERHSEYFEKVDEIRSYISLYIDDEAEKCLSEIVIIENQIRMAIKELFADNQSMFHKKPDYVISNERIVWSPFWRKDEEDKISERIEKNIKRGLNIVHKHVDIPRSLA